MATKTWKIGEYAKGGIIQTIVDTQKEKIVIIGKDWDFSAGSNKGSNQSNAKEWFRQTITFEHPRFMYAVSETLNDLTTSYYAEQIMDWMKGKGAPFNGSGYYLF